MYGLKQRQRPHQIELEPVKEGLDLPPSLAHLAKRVAEISEGARSKATRRAYEIGDRHWLEYIDTLGLKTPYPKAQWIIKGFPLRQIERGYHIESTKLHFAAVRHKYKEAGEEFPIHARDEKKFFRRLRGDVARDPATSDLAEITPKHAFSDELLGMMLASCDVATLLGKMEHSLVTTGIFGKFRESELSAMRIEHRRQDPRGQIITVPRSKANQDGPPESVPMSLNSNPAICPVRSLDRYLAALGETSGPLFRAIDARNNASIRAISVSTITRIIKRMLRRVGVAEEELDLYSSHSMRRTGITNDIRSGLPPTTVMILARIARRSTLARYVEDPFYWLAHA